MASASWALVRGAAVSMRRQTCRARSYGSSPIPAGPAILAVRRSDATGDLAHARGAGLARGGVARTGSTGSAGPQTGCPGPSSVRVQARSHAELLLDLLLDLVGEVGVIAQEVAGVLLALPELVALVGVPVAGLTHDRLLDTEVDQPALFTNSKTEQN